MSSEDNIVDELYPEMCENLKAGLAQRSAARAATTEDGHAVVGAAVVNPFTVALIESTVRSALEYAASAFGSVGVRLTLAHKDAIRQLIGPQVLAYCDTIIHGLQDSQVAKPL